MPAIRSTKRLQSSRNPLAAALVCLLALGVAVGVGLAYANWTDRVERATDGLAPVEYEAPPKPAAVLLVGDSFAGGSEMNKGPEWPVILDGAEDAIEISADAVGGTGYVNGGPEGDAQFLGRIAEAAGAYRPDVVMLAGGRNDLQFPPLEVQAAATKAAERAKAAFPDADLVILSPFSSGNPGREVREISAALRQVAQEQGATFVDVSDIFAGKQAQLIGRDGVHPTDAGHRLLAVEMAKRLRAAGLLRRSSPAV